MGFGNLGWTDKQARWTLCLMRLASLLLTPGMPSFLLNSVQNYHFSLLFSFCPFRTVTSHQSWLWSVYCSIIILVTLSFQKLLQFLSQHGDRWHCLLMFCEIKTWIPHKLKAASPFLLVSVVLIKRENSSSRAVLKS